MERKFYEKYTSLKKRKLLDEGLERKREEELKELYDAMKDWVRGLEKDKEELSELLADNEDELEKARQDFLADIRGKNLFLVRPVLAIGIEMLISLAHVWTETHLWDMEAVMHPG